MQHKAIPWTRHLKTRSHDELLKEECTIEFQAQLFTHFFPTTWREGKREREREREGERDRPCKLSRKRTYGLTVTMRSVIVYRYRWRTTAWQCLEITWKWRKNKGCVMVFINRQQCMTDFDSEVKKERRKEKGPKKSTSFDYERSC